MSRKLIFCVILTFAMLFTGTMLAAAQGPKNVYVDPYRSAGNEDGTQQNPYNTVKEGEAYAQSLEDGGNLYVKESANGSWGSPTFVPGVNSGAQGSPIPEATLMALLALLAIVIAIIGWWFLRRARHLSASANRKPVSRF
jgi:hypothetical protein